MATSVVIDDWLSGELRPAAARLGTRTGCAFGGDESFGDLTIGAASGLETAVTREIGDRLRVFEPSVLRASNVDGVHPPRDSAPARVSSISREVRMVCSSSRNMSQQQVFTR